MTPTTLDAGKAYNYTLTLADLVEPQTYTYTYTGAEQTFTATTAGTYLLEAWGAGGARAARLGLGTDYNAGRYNGRGGYTIGTISLAAGQTIYIYVGQKGPDHNAGDGAYTAYNGGGYASRFSDSNSGGGGGATDFRLKGGAWDDATSLNSRIMVAGSGGGGGGNYPYNSSGGGIKGVNAGGPNTPWYGMGTSASYLVGAGQTSYDNGDTPNIGFNSTGVFGKGADGGRASGGGGYYGGNTRNMVGSGGSSFISGMTGCVAIDPTDVTNDLRTQDTGGNTAALNYNSTLFGSSPTWNDGDEIIFTNASTIDGDHVMPDWAAAAQCGTMPGNTGNGFARITRISD
jgi:hypothetical protein